MGVQRVAHETLNTGEDLQQNSVDLLTGESGLQC